MKKIYERPTLLIQEFAVDRIMSGTGEEATQSDLTPLIDGTTLNDGSGTINLGDNNTLQSINYNDFILN